MLDHVGGTQSAFEDADDYAKVKPVRKRTKRRGISMRDSAAQQMWEKGYGTEQIARLLGMSVGGSTFGPIDPTPQPLGCYAPVARAGESGEARAFRRFPIDAHKPGPG